MLFFLCKDFTQKITAHMVVFAFAKRDGLAQFGNRRLFQRQVAGQYLGHVFINPQTVKILQFREPVQEENALDQLVGVLHLIDRFRILVIAEFFEASVLQHAQMHEILVEGRDDFAGAFHGATPVEDIRGTNIRPTDRK